MAGSRSNLVQHKFYCINCGNQGIPVWRQKGRQREKNHRKALYCTTCKMTINHVEIATQQEAERFRADFAAGRFATEAAESIEHFKRQSRLGKLTEGENPKER